ACLGSGFAEPLSLAVICDSMTHGSWEKIRDRVKISPAGHAMSSTTVSGEAATAAPDQGGERAWITTYVRERDAWLASVKRLAATRYRTQFFLAQIAISNWALKLPIIVHGVRLTCAPLISSTVGPVSQATKTAGDPPATANDPQPEAQPPEHYLDRVEQTVNAAAAKYDRIESVIDSVITRTDSAKSLWTTVVGTVSQTAWAVFGLIAGIPREVWFVVAVIIGVLCAIYLYRQIVLGRIRESRRN
ncbi:MAG: hypothetical protein ACREO5_13460, partial [Candidatus Binatia bacterium]